MSNISKDFVTKNGIILRGTNIVTGLTSQTNALQVDSGAAIAKNLIVGSTATIQGLMFATDTANAVSTTTASVVFSGGLAVAKDVRIGGTLYGFIDGLISTATNLANGSAGQIVYQIAPGVTGFTGPGLFGQVLTSGGSGSAPVYQSTTTLYVGRALIADNSAGTAAFANNLNGGKLGEIPFQTGTNATSFIGTGTQGSLLQMGANTASFVTSSTVQVGFAANLLAGAGGSIPYQSAANATTMLGIGANKSILVSNGTAPSWTINPTIGGNVIIEGNLTVQGTTTQVDSTVTNVTDPILTLGLGPGGTAPIADDAKDRGIAFAWTGTQAGLNTNRTGFFGFDRSTLFFTFITSASIVNEVVAPDGGTTRGAIDANLAGGTAGQLVYQSASNTTAFAGPGTAGDVLTSGGTGAPLYVGTTTLYVGRAALADVATQTSGTAEKANSLNGGRLGEIPYQIATSSTAFIGTGTQGSLLQMGANTATFVTTSNIYVNRSVFADNVWSGTAGQLVYQSAANTTAFAGPGTVGDILISNGTNGPQYQNTLTIAGNVVRVNSAVGVHSTVSGALQILNGGAAIGGGLFVDGVSTFTNNLIVNNSTGVHSTITGALQVLNGGVAVGGGLVVGGTVTATTFIGAFSGSADRANSLNGGRLGEIPYQVATSSTAFIGTGTIGSILQMSANTATFVTTSNIYINSSVNAQTLFGGTAGQINYQSAPGVTAFAGPGSFGQVLISNGTNGPLYQSTLTVGTFVQINSPVGVSSTVTGALQILNGGVAVGGGLFVAGIVTATNLAIINNATGAHSTVTGALRILNGGVAVGGGLFVGGTVTATTFVGTFSGTADRANNLTGGVLGQIAYQTAPNTTAFIGTGTQGSILQMGANTATFVTTANIYVNSAVNAQTLFGGTAGQLHYQSAPGVTAFAGPGTAGQVLTSGGTGAPTYVTTTSLYVGRAVEADIATGPAQNLQGGRLGEIPYQLAPNLTAFIGTGTRNSILLMGANTASFVTSSTVQVGFAANLLAGAGGSIPYQSAANATTMLNIGANNAILVSNGSLPSWTINPTIGGNLTVVGNLTVQGTTTQVDSTVTNVSDPIFTIGTSAGGTIPVSDDGRDRGIAFAWTGTQAGLNTGRTGFFGFDRSTLYFTFITSASITNEVVAPAGGTTRGAIDANLAGGTAGQLVYQSAADTTAFAGPGSAGNVLTSNGTSAPSYVTTTSLYVGRALVADTVTGPAANLAGGILGQIPYQLGPNSTAFIGTGTNGSLLQMGANTATFVTTGTVYVGFANQANNVRAGTAGQLVYQSAANTTAFAGPGTTGQVLISGGTGAPNYQNTLTVNASVVGVSSTLASTSTNTGALQVAGGIGVAGSVYVGNRVGFVNATNFSAVYQVYNPVTNSLDTVFG